MEMSRKEQQIPAIRFNGFTDAWEQRKLDDVSEKVTEKNKNRKVTETLTNSAEYGIISQSDFFDKDISNINNIDGYYVVRPDDFVYNPRISNYAPVGPIKRNNLNKIGVMSPLYYVFRIKDIDPSFLEKYFDTAYWHMFMKLNGDSGARSDRFAIKDSVFKQMPIPYPSIEEQVKLGNFFKQLDDTIALHQRQVNNYKLLKNSLIQQMFPQGGEQLPKMRFAGFSGEWVRKKLGEFVEINRGLTYKPEDVVSDGIRVLRSSNIKQDIFELRADDVFVRHDAAKIPEIKNGDILVTSANGSTALVGKHAIVDKLPSKTVHGGFMLVIRCEHNYFINTWMSSSEYKRVLQLVQGGNGAIGNLSKKVLEEAVIAIPSDEEQTKIGNFFKKLDDNITFHQQKTDDYQQLKKVLLQQMFL